MVVGATRIRDLSPIIGTWSFRSMKQKSARKEQHWLWRSCKPYLRDGSGVNFSMRGVSQ